MPKKVDREEKRLEFISASVDVIATEGLSAATLRRIAEVASCTTGSLTHYFDSRKVLILETLRSVHRSAGRRMANAVDSGGTDHDILLLVLLESLPLDDVRLKEWRVWLAFWAASMDDKELTKENARRYNEWFDLVRSLLEPLIKTKNLDKKCREIITLIDGLGVGIARQRTSPKLLIKEQDDCSTLLNDYIQANLF